MAQPHLLRSRPLHLSPAHKLMCSYVQARTCTRDCCHWLQDVPLLIPHHTPATPHPERICAHTHTRMATTRHTCHNHTCCTTHVAGRLCEAQSCRNQATTQGRVHCEYIAAGPAAGQAVLQYQAADEQTGPWVGCTGLACGSSPHTINARLRSMGRAMQMQHAAATAPCPVLVG